MNTVLVYGGKSCEHDISVITACLARGYFSGELYSVYFDKENQSYLVPNDYKPARHVAEKLKNRVVFLFGEKKIAVLKGKRISKIISVDVVVNCCHGLNGEDGTVAAMCNLLGAPVVGSPLIPSAVAMDKVVTKQVLNQMGLPTVKGFALREQELSDLISLKDNYSYPLIVKPSLLGSSIGVSVVKNDEELEQALSVAFKYDCKVLCEQALTDYTELNCAAMRVNGKIKTSKVDCPVTLNDILTFEDKYVSNKAVEKSIEVGKDIAEQVKEYTERIYRELGFQGVIRVDYLYDNKENKLYVNEINTIPGSLAYGLWEGEYTRTEYGQALVEQAVNDKRMSEQHVYVFDSGVLNGVNGIKKK